MNTKLEFDTEYGHFEQQFKMGTTPSDIIAQLSFERQFTDADIYDVKVNGKPTNLTQQTLNKINEHNRETEPLRTFTPVY